MEFSPQAALLQSSAPAQPAGVCPKPRLACGQGDTGGGCFPTRGFGPHLWPARVSLPPGPCIEAAQRWRGRQLNSGSEAEVLVESAQERAALLCLFPPRPALSREL